MDNLTYLINRIKREIPPQIIRDVFTGCNGIGSLRPNVDYIIREKILEQWLLPDINLVGGNLESIDISTARVRSVEGGMIISIPQRATAGKYIISAHSTSMNKEFGVGGLNAGQQLYNSSVPQVVDINARCQVIGPNVIFLEGTGIPPRYLHCILAYDSNLGDIQKKALPLLGDMAVLAAKAYAYNNFTIELEEAAVRRGVSIGRLADIVNEWSDSAELYNELLNTRWRKVAIMNDPKQHRKLIKTLIPKNY